VSFVNFYLATSASSATVSVCLYDFLQKPGGLLLLFNRKQFYCIGSRKQLKKCECME